MYNSFTFCDGVAQVGVIHQRLSCCCRAGRTSVYGEHGLIHTACTHRKRPCLKTRHGRRIQTLRSILACERGAECNV